MININTVFVDVNILAAKDQAGGYTSGDEFNKAVELAQIQLLEFHAQSVPEQRSIDALLPFIVSSALPITIATPSHVVPSDYYRTLEVTVDYVTNAVNCGDSNVRTVKAPQFVAPSVWQYTNESPIRKPSKRWPQYTYRDMMVEVRPGYNGTIGLRYIRYPLAAVWGYTTGPGGQVYNPATSTNFEWPEEQITNLVDILLYLKGIQIRDSTVINWLRVKGDISLSQ
jgi:hypothetical protein